MTDTFPIGGWKWRILESVKALHVCEIASEQPLRRMYIEQLKSARSDSDICIATELYIQTLEHRRSPQGHTHAPDNH
ncbi:hypothetical protein HTV13_07420 [Pseudomonas putida]|uniref:hypothetical protein n=1 Tax=Pseudomonas putida TaxID=303 RepID=UPI001571FEF9|nr:hypothetical protein [Pseudomonas putida]NSX19659.1 hypothetical protein [Pseudomonas putida]